MDHLSAAGSSATRNLTTTEPPKSLNRRKTVNFRFQRPHATSGSFFFNKPMRAMDSRRDFTSKKVFPGYFSELSEKANSGLHLSRESILGAWCFANRGERRRSACGAPRRMNPFDDLVSRRNYRHALFFLGLFFIALGFFSPRPWLQV